MALRLGQAVLDVLADTSKFDRSLRSGTKRAFDQMVKDYEAASARAGADGGEQISNATGRAALAAAARPFGNFAVGAAKLTAKAMGASFAVAGTAAAAGIVYTLYRVFQRLTAIDTAEGKMRGLGYTTRDIEGIMSDALAVVRGTAFGLDEAATLASNAVAAGIPPGKELQGYLKLIADTATVAGVDMAEMGFVFQDIAASGRVTGRDMWQFMNRGIPVLQILSQELGKKPEEISKMVSAGEIDFKTFARAMQNYMGDAAKASGDTFLGSMRNLQASISRIGANFLRPIFSQLTPLIQEVTSAFGGIEEGAQAVGTVVGPIFSRAVGLVREFVRDLGAGRGSFDWMKLATDLARALMTSFEGFLGVMRVWVPLLGAVVLGGTKLFIFLNRLLRPILENERAMKILTTAFLAFAGIGVVVATLNTVMGALAAYRAAMAGAEIATNAGRISQLVYAAALQAKTTVTNIATAANWLFNSSMMATIAPVLLVVAAIGALVAIFVIAYRRSERFRNIVNGAIRAVRDAWQATVSWFTDTAWPALKGVWDAVAGVAVAVWDQIVAAAEPLITFFRNHIIPIVEAVRDVFGSLFRLDFRGAWDAWLEYFYQIGRAAANLIPALVRTARNLLGRFLDALRAAWPAVRDWFAGLPGMVVSALGDFGRMLWDKGRSLLSGLLGGARDAGPGVLDWFRNLPVGILTAIGNLASALFAPGRVLIGGLLSGASEEVKALWAWIGAIPLNLGRLVTDADFREVYFSRGRALIGGLLQGAVARLTDFRDWLLGLPGRIRTWATELADTLVPTAFEMVENFVAALDDRIQALQDWLRTLPGRIGTWAAELARTLVPRAREMILGLIRGLQEAVPLIIAWFQDLPNKIGGWITSAVRWMRDNGPKLMKGLAIGLGAAVGIPLAIFVGLPLLLAAAVVAGAALLVYAGLQLVLAFAKAIGQALWARVRPVWESFVSWLQGLWAGVVDWFTGIFRTIGNNVSTEVGKMRDGVMAVVNPIVGAFQTIGIGIGRVAQSIFGFYRTWIHPFVQLFAAIVKWLWDGAVKIVTAQIQRAWDAVGRWLRRVYDSFIQPVIDAFARAFGWLYRNVVKPVGDAISAAFGAVGTAWRRVWNTYLKPVLDTFTRTARSVRDALADVWAKVVDRFTWLRDRFKAIITWIRDNVFNFASARARDLRDTLSGIWTKVVERFTWLRDRFRAAVVWVRDNVFLWVAARARDLRDTFVNIWNAVRDRFVWLRDKMREVFEWVRDKVFTVFGARAADLRDRIERIVGKIGDWWAKLQELARKPIAFVVNTVIQKGLVDNFNKLADKFPGVNKLPNVSMAGGGVLPGYTPRRDVHRFFSPTGGRLDLSGGEGIMVPEWVRAVGGAPVVAAMNRAARRHQKLAGGGTFQPVGPPPGNRHTSGYSWATWAGDFPRALGTAIRAWKAGTVALVQHLTTSYGKHVRINHDDGTSSLYAHLSQIGVRMGQQLAAGARIGAVGSTGNSTGPHLHFETMGGPYRGGQSGGVADAVLSVLSGLKDKVTGRIGEIADKFGEFKNSELAKMALAVPRRLLDGAVGWLTDAAGSVFDKATGLVRTGAAWVGAKVGAFSKAQLDNAATIISVARKLGFGDRGAQIALMTALQESTLRNINYGDRDSIGLFQQRRAWGTNAERMNPATAASMFFTGGRGGQPGLNAFDWQNLPLGVAAQKVQVSAFPDAYAKWADEARKLVAKFDNGGWLAPGHLAYNGSRSPELVVPRDRVGTGGVVNLNIRLDGSWNDDRAVGRLVRAISDYERRRGSVLVTRQAPATRTLARGHPEGGLARSLP